MKYTYLALFFYLSVLGCEQNKMNNTATFTKDDFKQTKLLSGKTLSLQALKFPIRILFIDSLLVIVNINTSKFVDIYSIRSGKLLRSIASKGKGPFELINCISVHYLKKENQLILTDNKTKKLLVYNFKKLITENDTLPIKNISLSEFVNNPLVLPNNKIIDTRTYHDSTYRFTIYKSNGKIDKYVGTHPNFGIKAQNSPALKEIYSADMGTSEKASKIILAYRYSDLIEIYNTKGDLLKSIQGPDFFLPKMKIQTIGNGTMAKPNKKAKEGYFWPIIGKDSFFVLYDGGYFYDKGYTLNKIFSFDLSGNPLFAYELDIPIFHFDVDWDNKVIYGLTHEPKPRVISFKF